MRRTNRMVALLLALVMVFTSIPANVHVMLAAGVSQIADQFDELPQLVKEALERVKDARAADASRSREVPPEIASLLERIDEYASLTQEEQQLYLDFFVNEAPGPEGFAREETDVETLLRLADSPFCECSRTEQDAVSRICGSLSEKEIESLSQHGLTVRQMYDLAYICGGGIFTLGEALGIVERFPEVAIRIGETISIKEYRASRYRRNTSWMREVAMRNSRPILPQRSTNGLRKDYGWLTPSL